jgi:hypothetical protein
LEKVKNLYFSGPKKQMVGIYRKIKQILEVVKKYSPFLDNVAPGLGTLVGSAASLADSVADGVNNVYDDYTEAKKSGKKYGLIDGVKSFARPPAAVNSLTRSYCGLHPRLKLKNNET